MSKSTEEITADIVAAGLSAGQIKTNKTGVVEQASDIASAYKTIYMAVKNPPPPAPAPLSKKKEKQKKR